MSKMYRNSCWDRDGIVEGLLREVKLPKMVKVRQHFDGTKIDDVAYEVRKELQQEKIASRIKPGMTIAITAGSRGINNYQLIMKTMVSWLKEMGAEPFLIPAMGSHGGGTAEGQRKMLESLGITEDSVGAPIRSTMDVVRIGTNCDGYPVFIDKYANEADGIIVFNRIKPHTNFRGEYESGLMKMMTIGLGKNVGAATCHKLPMDDMPHNVLAFGSTVLENANILFGLATVENAYDQVRKICALLPEEIAEKEKELQADSKTTMPKILFDQFDVLVVDKIGKNFSGPGMDPNVTGISGNPHMKLLPQVQRRVVLDISDETHGNATGIGLADFSTKRAFDKLDFDAGYPNNITSRSIEGGKIPLIMKNDRLALQAAIYTCDLKKDTGPRLVRIPNTLHLSTIEISEDMIAEAEKKPALEIVSDKYDFEFDENGNLIYY